MTIDEEVGEPTASRGRLVSAQLALLLKAPGGAQHLEVEQVRRVQRCTADPLTQRIQRADLPRWVLTPHVAAERAAVEQVWPLFGLRLQTARLVLRLPTGEEAVALASLAPDDLETDPTWPAPPGGEQPTATEVLQWWWRALGTWTVESWRLPLGVWLDGEPVGFQEIEAERFGLLRTVETSSWLVHEVRGRCVGTEMRAAVLALAFGHLGAEEATSGAWETNAGSLGVSRSLGYEANGEVRHAHHGRVGTMRRVRLPRAAWDEARYEVAVHGLDACRAWFGATS